MVWPYTLLKVHLQQAYLDGDLFETFIWTRKTQLIETYNYIGLRQYLMDHAQMASYLKF